MLDSISHVTPAQRRRAAGIARLELGRFLGGSPLMRVDKVIRTNSRYKVVGRAGLRLKGVPAADALALAGRMFTVIFDAPEGRGAHEVVFLLVDKVPALPGQSLPAATVSDRGATGPPA